MQIEKPQLSSIEIRAIESELKEWEGAKVDKVFEAGDNDFFIRLYKKGKTHFRFYSGKFAYICEAKPEMDEPRGFCMQLRKALNNKIIRKVTQVGAQRIVLIEFDDRKVYFELFSKGNVVLVDNTGLIRGALKKEEWRTRKVAAGEKYVLPPLEVNIFDIGFKEFYELCKKSEKNKLAAFLATQAGLGGTFAEHVIQKTQVRTQPSKLSEKEAREIFEHTRLVIQEATKAKGYITKKEVLPIKPYGEQEFESLESFSKAIEKVMGRATKVRQDDAFSKKMQKVMNVLQSQEKRLEEIDKMVDEYTKIGDKIYEKYSDIKKEYEKNKGKKKVRIKL